MAVLAVLAGALSACPYDDVDDPGEALWCEDRLCAWSVDRGRVEPVATWHERDPGVSLGGDEVRLSRVHPDERGGDRCVLLSVLADVAPGVTVRFVVDVGADGTAEDSAIVEGTRWRRAAALVRVPPIPVGTPVRLGLEKSGAAGAALANLRLDGVPCPAPASGAR
jgi:hypothetical protein